MTPDNGSIVLGWLTKLTLVMAALGLLAFDGIALIKTNFTAADHASAAASAGAETYRQTRNVQQAYDAAVEAASGNLIEPKAFIVDPTTGKVSLTVTQDAVTLWVYRVGPLKKYTVIRASSDATPSK